MMLTLYTSFYFFLTNFTLFLFNLKILILMLSFKVNLVFFLLLLSFLFNLSLLTWIPIYFCWLLCSLILISFIFINYIPFLFWIIRRYWTFYALSICDFSKIFNKFALLFVGFYLIIFVLFEYVALDIYNFLFVQTMLDIIKIENGATFYFIFNFIFYSLYGSLSTYQYKIDYMLLRIFSKGYD
jgi:hypothetical protein